jgi:hypothetical protein
MEKTSKDPTDTLESGTIVKDGACCEDGCCSLNDNTPAQSEEDKTLFYTSVPGADV